MDFTQLPFTFLKELVKHLNSLEVINLLVAIENHPEKVIDSYLFNLLFPHK